MLVFIGYYLVITATVMGRRIAYQQAHNLLDSSLHIMQKINNFVSNV